MAVVTMAQTLYADLEDLKSRVREETLLDCLDWDRDGVIDNVPLYAILNPASTDIDMALQTAAGIYKMPFKPPFPPALREIALDGCEWRVSARYPRIYEVDVAALQKKVEAELTKIRQGKLSLGQNPPEATGNAIHGGGVYPSPKNLSPKPPVFTGPKKWGIF